jgi:phosphoribosylamine--glycine ligase
MKKMTKVLLIGKSGRLDAMAEALYRSSRNKEIYLLSEVNNPGLSRKAREVWCEPRTDDPAVVERYALELQPDFAIIGPEEPLAAGVVDRLRELGIPAVGPTASLARLESSKAFTRALFEKYQIPGRIRYRTFKTEHGLEAYLHELREFVVKPDGLTGGKGVRVFGDHFTTIEEGLSYCRQLLASGTALVVEEKLIGEEFSFQSFCDGRHVVDMIPVQDHKRAEEGDRGPNTGGMGSYSCEDHLLPFLTQDHIYEASRINKAVAAALLSECGEEYKGIIYGSFILTKDGLKVIEYNARFGDPEAMNVLPLLKTDFIDICEAIISGTLDKLHIVFDRKATVCKYVVPRGYPSSAEKGAKIDLSHVSHSRNLRIYYGAVSGTRDDDLELTGSRAVAFVGIGDNLKAAEEIAEHAATQVIGPVRHRTDIGTAKLVEKRADHMKAILGAEYLYAAQPKRAV